MNFHRTASSLNRQQQIYSPSDFLSEVFLSALLRFAIDLQKSLFQLLFDVPIKSGQATRAGGGLYPFNHFGAPSFFFHLLVRANRHSVEPD
jgi:hypothetical protein